MTFDPAGREYAALPTAQRCGEVTWMRRHDAGLATGWWTIPGDATKNAERTESR